MTAIVLSSIMLGRLMCVVHVSDGCRARHSAFQAAISAPSGAVGEKTFRAAVSTRAV